MSVTFHRQRSDRYLAADPFSGAGAAESPRRGHGTHDTTESRAFEKELKARRNNGHLPEVIQYRRESDGMISWGFRMPGDTQILGCYDSEAAVVRSLQRDAYWGHVLIEEVV
jgi:hypothetical protein